MLKDIKELTSHEALVLQQLGEVGVDELDHLSRELMENPRSLLNTLQKLKRKGLIKVVDQYDDIMIFLTSSGRRTIHYIWPLAQTL